MARANRISRVRGLGCRLGDDGSGIDWGSIITTGITTAGVVAKTAVTPPAYQSIVNPYTGAQSITSYGGVPNASLLGATTLGGMDFTSLLSSPIVLLGGLALIAVIALKR